MNYGIEDNSREFYSSSLRIQVIIYLIVELSRERERESEILENYFSSNYYSQFVRERSRIILKIRIFVRYDQYIFLFNLFLNNAKHFFPLIFARKVCKDKTFCGERENETGIPLFSVDTFLMEFIFQRRR